MTDRLPELLDAKALQRELSVIHVTPEGDEEFSVTRAAAEKIMRTLPTVQFPGLRKVYVRRDDVEQLLKRCTFAKDQVPA